MTNLDFLEINGAMGEGGGAILRLGAAFSILFKQPIRIKNIRANRPKPGLRTQHLLGLKILSELTSSTLSECDVGTKEITLIPKTKIKDKVQVNISTAASLGLLLQPIQITCLGLNKPEKIELLLNGGGTFGKWAPSLTYLQKVTFRIFENSGLKIDINIDQHGFYPKGGAKVKCSIYPPTDNLKPINIIDLGNLENLNGEIILTNQLKRSNINERIKTTIEQQVRKNIKLETNIKYKYVNSYSPGVGLFLWAHSDTGAIISTGTILGEKRITSEKLGMMATNEILKYIKNEIPVDNFLSDQLIPLMAYCRGASKIKVLEITNHTKTNLELIQSFSPRKYNIIKENNYFIIEFQETS
ncbi:MAG: RNA 3'-terminal phosphate cyclase [Candidatus Hodarchaeota archaeon]